MVLKWHIAAWHWQVSRVLVKGGNKFAIAGGHHFVHVSQRMMGTRWSWEEWKPNMAKLEVCVVFLWKKMLKPRAISLQVVNFSMWHYLLDVFTLFREELPKTWMNFLKIQGILKVVSIISETIFSQYLVTFTWIDSENNYLSAPNKNPRQDGFLLVHPVLHLPTWESSFYWTESIRHDKRYLLLLTWTQDTW